MKKFLSLVLALVMTMSLVTISAGAKDFADDSKINYKEAVDVVSAVKIVDGYADGSFNPSATLTRGAAAKIICNMILGPTTASALVADAAPYKDVPVNHTFAGYIAYCQKEGIISGYADGTFRPAASLTGYAFMKMLLGALGYDAATEGYTGANWSINVAKRALQIGLDDDLVDDFNGIKAVNREEAALYAFNTLQADVVTYGQQTNISIGGAVINIGNKAEAAPAITGRNYNGAKAGSLSQTTLQFCEKYFSKLIKSDPNTAFDEPSTTWRLSGKKIGDYADDAKETYTEQVKMKEIYADLGLSEKADKTLYYVNGQDLTNTAVYNVEGSGTKGETKVGGQGTVTTVFSKTDSDTGKVTVRIVEKQQFIAKITSIDEATKTADRVVNLTGKNAASLAMMAGNNDADYKTDDFARGDYVYFTTALDSDDNYYVIKSLEKAEKVTGVLTAYTGNTSVVVDGTTYKVNAVGMGGQAYGGNLKDTVDLYLDANGNVLAIETAEASATSYAVVVDNKSAAGTSFDPYKAQLLFLDGTKKIVETKDSAAGQVKQFVKYRVDSDDKYVLMQDSTMSYYANGAKIDNGKSALTVNATTYYANDATIFVVKTPTSGGTYTVYTGHKNVPNINNLGTAGCNVAVACTDSTSHLAKYVYVEATNLSQITGGTSNVTFILGSTTAGLTENSDSKYYTFKAIDNGAIGELKVDGLNAYAATLLGGDTASIIIRGKTTDKYGVASIGAGADVAVKATGVGEVKNSTIELDTYSGDANPTYVKALDAKCNVFVVTIDGELKESSVDAIAYDDNDVVFYTTVDDLGGIVDNIFIVKK